ncbi:hypothetical protein OROMI_030379 [Orobanche minor]
MGFGPNAAGDLTLNGRTAAEDWASLTKDIATCLADIAAKRGRPFNADSYLYHLRLSGCQPAVNQVDSNNKMIKKRLCQKLIRKLVRLRKPKPVGKLVSLLLLILGTPVPKADEETSEAEKAEAGGVTSEPTTTSTRK